MSSTHTNMAITANRTYHIKLITGMLPTMDKLHQRRPLLYTNNLCKRCGTCEETNEHLWNCSTTTETRRAIFEEAQQNMIDNLSPKDYNFTQQDREQIKQTLSIMPIMNQCNKTREEIKRAFRHYLCDELKYTFNQAEQSIQYIELFKQEHAIRGIVPKILTTLLDKQISQLKAQATDNTTKALIGDTLHKLPNVVSRYISEISTKAKERIWKIRCDEVQAWEHEQQITRQNKQAPYSTKLIGPKPRKISKRRTQAHNKRLHDEREQCTKRHKTTNNHFIQLVKGHRETDAFTNPNTKIKFSQHMLWKEVKAVVEVLDNH